MNPYINTLHLGNCIIPTQSRRPPPAACAGPWPWRRRGPKGGDGFLAGNMWKLYYTYIYIYTIYVYMYIYIYIYLDR